MTPDLIFKILGDRRLRAIVALLVLAALAQQVSLLIWHLVPAPPMATNSLPATIERAFEPSSAGANYQQQASAISREFLFGKPDVQAQPVAVAEEAPETQLNYKLRGIYYSPDESLSSAIVETRPNDSQNYLIGQALAENITLARIEQDYILINRYGKLERLNLEKPDALAAGRADALAASGVTASQAALLRSYKQRYNSNPMALATRFQAIPVQQDGSNIGFKLKALRGESLLKKLNFEPDDVFTAVNGVSLKNPFEALDALKSLATSNDISVTFLRNGAEQTLDFRL